MIEKPWPTLNPNRLVSKAPNSLLDSLIDHNPGFFSEHNTSLCAKTPVNMVAALVLRSLADQICNVFAGENYDLSQNHQLYHPVSLLTDVPVEHPAGKVFSPYVLYKECCGRLSAVALVGDLSGLIMNPYPLDVTLDRGMSPNRLWNDDPFTELSYDMPTFFTTLSHKFENEPTNLSLIQCLHFAVSLFEDRFLKLAQKHQYPSRVFFELCCEVLPDKIARQMNYDNFYRTYPQNSL